MTGEQSLPETEHRNRKSKGLEKQTTADIVGLMIEQEQEVVRRLDQVRGVIAEVIEKIVVALQSGGRLFYVGAGTSGRLGVLDASECPPTFGVSPELVQGIIAGGDPALRRAIEGAEDSPEGGAKAIEEHGVMASDVVVGIAASGRTPFVHGALVAAKKQGAFTVLLTCVSQPPENPAVDRVIRVVVGAELLTGSTRLKAGTATKLVLNMLSTVTMIRLGKTYDNLMVDLQASNQKLRERAIRIFTTILSASEKEAQKYLKLANWHLKPALVMFAHQVDYATACECLDSAGGILSLALEAK